ncbi:hypothetical protein [Polyangium aurulentum]|uniref:hypothetical protein n=1 Tax=Polyangium aurulentum TaxID=2567896 RepID=UPI0010AE156B|nr:hypothetical protein [Polyangium aurulentum]UQA57953.1 hypothetical protein E8A73_042910 [Polyangium aurulentum]
MHVLLGRLSGLLSLAGFIPYVIAILRGKTRPSLATWGIWAGVGAILCASAWAAGARASIWTPVSYALGPSVVTLIALRYGERGLSRFDLGCIAAAAASLLLWYLAETPLVALLINIVIDLVGALPTLRKTWHDPDSEDRLSWGLFCAANLVNLAAIERWRFAEAVYPVYLVGITGAVNAVIWWRRGRAS